MYKFLCRHVFIFLSSVIVGSYCNSIFSLSINCQTVLSYGCIILHSHQQCARIPIFSRWSILTICLFILVTLTFLFLFDRVHPSTCCRRVRQKALIFVFRKGSPSLLLPLRSTRINVQE